MNYTLTQKPLLTSSQCIVIGIFSDSELPSFVLNLATEQQRMINRLSQKATQRGDMLWHHDHHDMQDFSLLLVQCGKQSEFKAQGLQKIMTAITEALLKQRLTSATLCLPLLPNQDPEWQLEQMILQIDAARYQLLDFKKKDPKPHLLENISFYLPNADENTLELAKAIASGIELTRNLANLPANICTPTYLAEEALKLEQSFSTIQCKIMGPEAMRKMGMGLLLAVSQGSNQPPRLVDIQYKGAGNEAPIVLVGKGITFDSGGLSIKPANSMDEMKYDMSGAASVLGVIKACALLKLPVNVTGIIACAENLLSGDAVKPGDIVTSLSGQTVEIINTDAEGRLVLADALTYAEQYKPKFVIDIATLTGAMVVALGAVATGFMTQDDELAQLIEQAAQESRDRVWRLPLDEEYQDALDSPLADMINANFDRSAGSITAACFLSRFTEQYRWAHLDIAGTAWISGKKRNATGRPVPLLTQLIRHVCKKN